MLLIKKIKACINYFYFGSYKFKNYNLTILKFFFEKSNKVNTNFLSLGSVFRNSKWRDLKIQNTKNNLTSEYKYVILFIIFFILIPQLFNVSLLNWVYLNYWGWVINFKCWFDNLCFTLSITLTLYSYEFKKRLGIRNVKVIEQVLNVDKKTNFEKNNSKSNQSTNNVSRLTLVDLKNYYTLVDNINCFDHSQRLYNFRNSLNSNNYFISSGSFKLDVLLVSSIRTKSCRIPNFYNSFDYTNCSVSNLFNIYNLNTYYSNLTLVNLNATNINSSGIRYDLVTDITHVSKTDRWLAKDAALDRGLTKSNTSYRLSNSLIPEFTLVDNFSNDNLWNSNLYNKNNFNLVNYNRTEFNTFFYKNFSSLSSSRVFNQVRLGSLTLNKPLNYSFFLKYVGTVLNYKPVGNELGKDKCANSLPFFKKIYINTLLSLHLNSYTVSVTYVGGNSYLTYDFKVNTPVNYLSSHKSHLNFFISNKFFFKKKAQKTYQ